MSRVFVATETALDRPVVLKVLPPELGHAVSVDRFRQEIRLAARLQHPHIVPLHSAGEAAGLLYYTMPLVEGESLRTRLTRSGELAVKEAVRVLRDVAAALAYAHEHGVVHRDIKPDNVLLSGGEALVSDFGVAKALSASATGGDSGLTSLGVALGTPAYMAPEQGAADPQVDHRADLYAWGCLAYECLTGQPPFTGRQPAGRQASHAGRDGDQGAWAELGVGTRVRGGLVHRGQRLRRRGPGVACTANSARARFVAGNVRAGGLAGRQGADRRGMAGDGGVEQAPCHTDRGRNLDSREIRCCG
jgi:serine/threonine protein kinase